MKDLQQAIERVGESANKAGVSSKELTRVITEINEITSINGSIIGNSIKTIFTRLQRQDTLSFLEQYGISTKHKNNRLKKPLKLIGEISDKWDTFESDKQNEIAERIGGIFQINIAKVLFSK